MGYDTTLHLVDERGFELFEDYFFDPHPEDDAIRLLRRKLETKAEDAGSTLTFFSLLQVSAVAPYLTDRNMALSLWDRQMGEPFPEKWIGSLEERFPRLCARYPGIELPCWFDGNYSTGVFVAPAQVPEVYEYVADRVARLPPDKAWYFRRLVRVLRVAAERGLGYWEGTEVDVVPDPPHPEWLEVPVPPDVTVEDSPIGGVGFTPFVREPEQLVVDDGEIVMLDTTTFPPKATLLMECESLCLTPWGTTLYALDEGDSTIRLFEYFGNKKGQSIDVPFKVGLVRRIGNRVIAIPAEGEAGVPHVIEKGLGKRRKTAPLAVPPREHDGVDDAIPFDESSFLLIWDGVYYRCAGNEVTRLPSEPGAVRRVAERTAALDGSIVGVFGGKVKQILPNGTVTSIGGFRRPYHVARGLDGTAVVCDWSRTMIKVWWPATREITPISHERFGLDEWPDGVFTTVRDAQLVVIDFINEKLHAIPWSVIAAMPRVPEDVLERELASYEELDGVAEGEPDDEVDFDSDDAAEGEPDDEVDFDSDDAADLEPNDESDVEPAGS